jgi:CBS-domain-containing membrane protein
LSFLRPLLATISWAALLPATILQVVERGMQALDVRGVGKPAARLQRDRSDRRRFDAEERVARTIAQLMTQAPEACRPTDSVERAAQIMWEHDCGCVPIVDDTRHAVGVLTDRDICMAAYSQGKALRDIDVGSCMTRDLATCRPEARIDEAERTMRDAQVRRLLVVDDAGSLCGLVAVADLARAVGDSPREVVLTSEEVAQVIASVSQPRQAVTH